MTDVEAAKLLTMLITAWPDGLRWLSEEQQADTRKLYRDFLQDLPYREGDHAVRRLIATWRPTSAQRWPSIAELRAAITLQIHGRTPTALEAWGAIRKLGNPQTPELWDALDPVVRMCLDSLGWVVRETLLRGGAQLERWRVSRPGDSDSETADRARWVELYDQLTTRVMSERVVGLLAPPIPVRRLAAGSVEQLGAIVQRLLPKGSEQDHD